MLVAFLALAVAVQPAQLRAEAGATATVTISAPDATRLVLWCSAGELSAPAATGEGTFVATYRAPPTTLPMRIVIAAWDETSGEAARTTLALAARLEVPIETEARALVTLSVHGRRSTARANAAGVARVTAWVGPDERTASVVARDAAGNASTTEMALDVPPAAGLFVAAPDTIAAGNTARVFAFTVADGAPALTAAGAGATLEQFASRPGITTAVLRAPATAGVVMTDAPTPANAARSTPATSSGSFVMTNNGSSAATGNKSFVTTNNGSNAATGNKSFVTTNNGSSAATGNKSFVTTNNGSNTATSGGLNAAATGTSGGASGAASGGTNAGNGTAATAGGATGGATGASGEGVMTVVGDVVLTAALDDATATRHVRVLAPPPAPPLAEVAAAPERPLPPWELGASVSARYGGSLTSVALAAELRRRVRQSRFVVGLDLDARYAAGAVSGSAITLGGAALRVVGEARFHLTPSTFAVIALAVGGTVVRERRAPATGAATTPADGGPSLGASITVLKRLGPGWLIVTGGFSWAPLVGLGLSNVDGVALTVGYRVARFP